MMQDHNLIIVLNTFNSSIDANIAKSKLDAYGIPCFLTEENMANLYPGASTLMNFNVRLHILQEDEESARHIMAEMNLDVSDDTVMQCPACRSNNVHRDFPKKLTTSFFSELRFLFFGIFNPEKKVCRCADCECEF
ncbi:MAG: DUF2007 domain-containing protein [Chryseolinea sp.]